MKTTLFWKLFVGLVLVSGLVGCLDMETTIDIAESGAGSVVIGYTIDNRLLDLGVFDGPTDEPAVPVSRRDFELAVSGADGARLGSYEMRRGDSHTQVSARVEFDEVEAINSLLGRNPDFLALDDRGLRLVLFTGRDSPLQRELVEDQFGGYSLRFRVTADREISAVSRGSIVDGGASAELVVGLADAVLARDDLVWRVDF